MDPRPGRPSPTAPRRLPPVARVLSLAATLAAAACATVPPGAGSNPADPWERVNRQTAEFNDRLDRIVLKPAAGAYKGVVPKPVRDCIMNAFFNLGEVGNAANALLQGKPTDVATDTSRLVINSTVGLLGCFDVARGMGLARNRQDFGLTLGKWGFGPGPYVVLPLMGPHSLRDAIGEVPDHYTDVATYVKPTTDSYLVSGAYLVQRRAQLLDATQLVDEIALDKYQFERDAYLQQRRSRVYDGNPPPPAEDDDPGP